MISFTTNDPASLLAKFDAAITKGNTSGGITTWQKVGNYYTHAAAQWHNKAYFGSHVQAGKLVFNIVKNKSSDISVLIYAYYHGHLLETFLNHFDSSFTNGSATAMPAVGDLCAAAA